MLVGRAVYNHFREQLSTSPSPRTTYLGDDEVDNTTMDIYQVSVEMGRGGGQERRDKG